MYGPQLGVIVVGGVINRDGIASTTMAREVRCPSWCDCCTVGIGYCENHHLKNNGYCDYSALGFLGLGLKKVHCLVTNTRYCDYFTLVPR